jgi:hypothetical protein
LSGCLLCQNGTAQNPQKRWRHKRSGAPPSDRRIERTPVPTPPLPGMPPAPTGNNAGAQNLKSTICRLDSHIRTQLFPVRNVSMMMRIPSPIPILILICWLMKVSKLSVLW